MHHMKGEENPQCREIYEIDFIGRYKKLHWKRQKSKTERESSTKDPQTEILMCITYERSSIGENVTGQHSTQ